MNKLHSNFVFTTEGHFISLPLKKYSKQAISKTSVKAFPTCSSWKKRDTTETTHPPLLKQKELNVLHDLVYTTDNNSDDPSTYILKYVFPSLFDLLLFIAVYRLWQYTCSLVIVR